jgi:hypothetical protein
VVGSAGEVHHLDDSAAMVNFNRMKKDVALRQANVDGEATRHATRLTALEADLRRH